MQGNVCVEIDFRNGSMGKSHKYGLCLLTHTKLGQNHIKMKLVMFSTNSLFKAKLRLIYIFLGFVLKTEPKRTSLLGLLSRWLTPSQNTKENF